MRTRKRPAALVMGLVLLLALVTPMTALADHVPPQTHDLGPPGSPQNECTNAFIAVGALQPGDVVTGWKIESGPFEPGNPDTDYQTFTSGGFSVDVRYRTVADNRLLDFQNADPAVNAVVLKAGTNSNVYYYGAGASAAVTADTSLTAPMDSISHITFCTLDREEDPEVTVTFTKIWTGDDKGDATASLLLDSNPVAFGETVDVTAEQGNTLSLEEIVEDLPENCTYTSDLPAGLDVPVVEVDTHLEIDVTNDVDCDEPEDPEVTVTFTKIWTGDDEGDAIASLLVEGLAFEFGVTIDVTEVQGETLSLEEVVEGLADECTYTSDLPDSYEVPVADGEDINDVIIVTNEVDCTEVLGEVIEREDEVKGVVRTASTTTLPKTGASTLLLMLLGLSALGTGTTLARRRR